MKKKEFNKKLGLKKETITNLDNNALKNVKGGDSADCSGFGICRNINIDDSHWLCV